MPGCGKLSELQKIYGSQEKAWFEGMHTIRQAVDIEKLCYLLQDSNCHASIWFPNNAEIKKLAAFLVENGVTVNDEK